MQTEPISKITNEKKDKALVVGNQMDRKLNKFQIYVMPYFAFQSKTVSNHMPCFV